MERFVGDELSCVMTALAISKDVKNDLSLRLYSLECLYKNISVTSQYLEYPTVTEILENIVLESGNKCDNNWKYFQIKQYAFSCLEKVAACRSDEFFQNYYLYLKKQLNLNLCESRQEKNFLKKTQEALFYPQKCLNILSKVLEPGNEELVNAFYWNQKLSTEMFVNKSENRSNVPETKYIPEIEKLDRYMNTCDKTEKFRMLKTLSIHIFESIYEVNLSIFKEFRSNDWGKELLTYTLLSNNNTWNVNQTSKLVREINRLDMFLKKCNCSYCIEDILEILITTEKTCELDIEFIVKVLTLLHSNESLDLVFEDFCFLPNVFSQLELFQLKQKCNDQKIIYTDENQIKKLQYLLFYSDDVVDIVLSKVKLETPITKLIDFFQIVKEKDINKKEDFLLQLNPNGSIEDWERELTLPLIETFICQEFPGWEYETATDIISNFDKIYFSSVNADDSKECTTYCQFNCAQKNELREAVNLGNSKLLLHKLLYDLKNALSKLILICKFSEAMFEEIKKLIRCLDSKNKIIQLINALEILVEYEINISQNNVIEIISNSTEINVQKNIHDFIFKSFFSKGTYEKSVDQLIDELVRTNREENIMLLKNQQDLMAEYNKVMNAYNGKSALLKEEDLIKNWDKETIKKWSSLIKLAGMMKKDDASAANKSIFMQTVNSLVLSNPSITNLFNDEFSYHISLHERIAVIKRAMELTAKIKLRDVQMLSIILLLKCQKDKGRLAQINTGEGKTIIIAIIAAYRALEGHQVDIITSSKLLAIPQSEQLEEFYSTLCLVVSHNFNSTKAYKVDVLYGTSNEFQGDILLDEFRKSGCRHGRKCDVAIVDEVDNMLIDGKNHFVLLSCEMPAMDHLDTILATIYAQVKEAAGSIIVNDGQSFFIERENIFDKNGEKKEFIENLIPIEGTMRDFIMNSTELHIRNLIRDCDLANPSSDFPEIKIPIHLREVVCKTQLNKWVARAIAAKFDYIIKKNYILDDNKIKIVDANNTGVIQQSMRWSDGLHQFLEIKHGTNITPERLTSNFISNVSFFRRYRPKIYGLSGTLGCQGTKKLLAKTYDLDFIIVPPFKFKQHKEIKPIIVNNRDDWHREIVKSSLRKLCNRRAVLIIMEYIHETEAIEKIFVDEFGYDERKVKLYKTDNDSSVVEKPLESGHVIVTTNIAGRGTDIKLTKDVNKNGGLHVCITFLPKNSRVEEQNVGRTSRTGNCGTSQFILCNSETDIAKLRKNRDEKEEETLRNAEKEIEVITTKDEIFQKFCQLMDLIEGRNAFVKEIERQAVEERFAIWLKMHSDEITNDFKSDFFNSFESFREEILRDDNNGKLIKNPYMFVMIGNKYLNDKKYKDAISEYTLAIEMDPYFAEHAHYNRGYAYIAEYGGNATKNKCFINKAIDDFKTARKLIQEKEYNLHLMQHASEGAVFSKQVYNKLNLYNIQKNAIDLAIGPDIEAIDREIDKKIEEYEEVKEHTQTTSDNLKKISNEIKNLKAQKDNVGVIQKAQSNKRDIKIEIIEMKKCLPENDQSHDHEITAFKRNGAIGSFQISEIPPIDWISVIGLLLLGFGQLIGGAALTVFSFVGASFGMSLIAEGISDIVTAVKDGIINRCDFNWAKWGIEKAISLTVSVVCAGWKVMKDVAKIMYSGVKTAASIGSKVVTQTMKEGWKLVAKRVGLKLTTEITKTIVSDLVDYGVSQTIVPLIQQKIMEKVQGPIEEALKNNPLVKMMLELDQINNNQYHENRIMAMGMELLQSRSSRDTFDLVDIAVKIGNRIADNKIPELSAARQVNAAIEAVVELSTLTEKFIHKLNQSLDEEAEKDKLEQQSENKLKIMNQQETTKQESAFKKIQKDGEKIESDIDLNLLHKKDEQAKLQKTRKDVKGISKSFVDVISTTIVNSIQQKLINPIVQKGVNYSIESITSNVTKCLDEHVETYRSHRRIIHYQNKGFGNAKTKKERNTVEENQRINKVEALIDEARSGGPSGLVHLGAVSDAIDRPIEVYNKNGQLKYIIGDTKKGIPAKIQYHESESEEKIGHYTLLGNKEPIENSVDRNMCLYNVLALQTGRDPNELKNSSLQIMENNKSYMAKQVDDINRLEIYSQLRLDLGGAIYKGESVDDAKEILRNSTGAKAFNINKLGHPLKHAPFTDTTNQKLKAISQHLKKKIIVYDENGKVLYSEGNDFKEALIELDYHKSGEYFSSRDGNEPYYGLHDPNDKNLYNIVGNQTKYEYPNTLCSMINSLNQNLIHQNTYCIENHSTNYKNKIGPTGFLSQADMNYVTHHALMSDSAKETMERLNNLDFDQKLTLKDCREVLIIPVKDLGVSRKIYGQHWLDGHPIGKIKPAKRIVILLQHHDGRERDSNAPVHIHTIYPEL